MLKPYLFGKIDTKALADYCNSTGLSADPVVHVLVTHILERAEADVKLYSELFVKAFAEAYDKLGSEIYKKAYNAASAEIYAEVRRTYFLMREEKPTFAFDSLGGRRVEPVGQKAMRRGPKDKYMSTILSLLRRTNPLKRSELVRQVLIIHKDAGKGAVYRAIEKAAKAGKITPDRKNIYLAK